MNSEATDGQALPVLYRDDRYVAVHKPSGLIVHRSALDRGETRFCLQILRDQLGQSVHPCHRLDKPTSGILLFALDIEALQAASRLLVGHQMRKTYQALVRGWIGEAGVIEHQLQRIDKRGQRTGVGQDALTRYRCLQQYALDLPVGPYATARYSLVELQPETGRTHQLRRHLKHISHPIIGDTRHGDGRHNTAFRDHFACHRLMLAATRLAFAHPFTGACLDIACPPEPSFQRVVELLPFRA